MPHLLPSANRPPHQPALSSPAASVHLHSTRPSASFMAQPHGLAAACRPVIATHPGPVAPHFRGTGRGGAAALPRHWQQHANVTCSSRLVPQHRQVHQPHSQSARQAGTFQELHRVRTLKHVLRQMSALQVHSILALVRSHTCMMLSRASATVLGCTVTSLVSECRPSSPRRRSS